MLIQEFSLEVDKGLLVSLFDLVMPLLPPPPSSQIGLVQDLSAAHQPLVRSQSKVGSGGEVSHNERLSLTRYLIVH